MPIFSRNSSIKPRIFMGCHYSKGVHSLRILLMKNFIYKHVLLNINSVFVNTQNNNNLFCAKISVISRSWCHCQQKLHWIHTHCARTRRIDWRLRTFHLIPRRAHLRFIEDELNVCLENVQCTWMWYSFVAYDISFLSVSLYAESVLKNVDYERLPEQEQNVDRIDNFSTLITAVHLHVTPGELI